MEQAARKPERHFPAIAVSHGIGIGHVVFLHGDKWQFPRRDLAVDTAESESIRFRAAVDEALKQLQIVAADVDADPLHPVTGIFGVHQLILESSFIERIDAIIREQSVNAEWAILEVLREHRARQEAADDQYFKDKYIDIEDVANRLLTVLNGPDETERGDSNAVIVARDLQPSAIVELAKSNPAGIITTSGGWTSHTSILAREFKLPMVSGIRDLENVLSDGDSVIVDGFNGEIIVNPEREVINDFRLIDKERITQQSDVDTGSNSCTTLDGTEIAIRMNADLPDAYLVLKDSGARGIGLYRSESLIKRPGEIPSEDAQVTAYRKAAEAAGEFGVKIRTFDTGTDQLGFDELAVEQNPSLGLRSIRLSLSVTTHFRTQIRAILRAAAGLKIDIVLPMISGVNEIVRSKAIIEEERSKLAADDLPFGDTRLGAMIEVPSAVLTAREIASKVDFLCLGTNDLVQYLLAVDRDNDSVADWYQTLHPAVIRAVIEVLSAADDAGLPATVCGEMAGSAFYVPLLIGLGVRELSMNVNSIKPVKRLISGISLNDLAELAETVKTLETAEEIEGVLRAHYLQNWHDLFPPGLIEAKHR